MQVDFSFIAFIPEVDQVRFQLGAMRTAFPAEEININFVVCGACGADGAGVIGSGAGRGDGFIGFTGKGAGRLPEGTVEASGFITGASGLTTGAGAGASSGTLDTGVTFTFVTGAVGVTDAGAAGAAGAGVAGVTGAGTAGVTGACSTDVTGGTFASKAESTGTPVKVPG